MATTKEDIDLCWSSFIPTMQFGKRKLVVWNVAALLEHLEEPPFQAVCLFFLDSKKIARCKVTLQRAIMMDDFRAPPPPRWMTQLSIIAINLCSNGYPLSNKALCA